MSQPQQRGNGWGNLVFALAIWLLLIAGAPVLVHFLYETVSPWLPR